jgi:pimeloyl-ACP methyl ester carboxylesterase
MKRGIIDVHRKRLYVECSDSYENKPIWLSHQFRNWNIEYLLKDIYAPLLFIQGENDEYGTLEQVGKTLSGVSGPSEKLIIPDIGHTPHKEVPEMVLKKSAEFIIEINKLE